MTSRSRDDALLLIEERLVACVEDLRAEWEAAREKTPYAPMPPHYVNALREAHKALLAGMVFEAKRGGNEATDPATLLLQLEEAKEAVRRRMVMQEKLAEAASEAGVRLPSRPARH